MAVPVVESSATTNFGTGTSVTITKPTGLAVDDLLVATIMYTASGGTNSASAPAGWSTLETVDMTDSFRRLYVFYKVATSTETAASNFSFTTTGTCSLGGGLMRISGLAAGNEIQTSEQDLYSSTSTTSISFTGALTPDYTDSLVLMVLGAFESGQGSTTMSSYGSTPTKTWAEVYDFGNTDGQDANLAVASATSGVTTEITAYSATLSASKSTHGGVLMIINAPQDETGNSTFFDAAPAFFANTASYDTNANSTFISTSPNFPLSTGSEISKTQWTSDVKETSTWNQDTKESTSWNQDSKENTTWTKDNL